MLNLYELFSSYGIAHQIAWEAYRLSNGLIVKIDVGADPRYPFRIGDEFNFVSHALYSPRARLYVKDYNQDVIDRFPEKVIAYTNTGAPEYELHKSQVVEKIDLPKIIDMSKTLDVNTLNFTLNGMPLFSEVLVFMMKEISDLKKEVKSWKA